MAFADDCLKLLKKVFTRFPIKRTIVFESNPAFCDNTWPIYRYLVEKKHIDNDFKIVWLTDNRYTDKVPEGNEFVQLMNYGNNNPRLFDKFYYRYLMYTSVGLIYCNRVLGFNRPDQYSIMLQHGMPLKASNGGYCIHDNCTECLCVSEYFKDYYHKDFDISYEKMFFGYFPRTDYFFTKEDILKKFGIDSYDKVLMWLPTYRKSNVESMHGFNIEGSATGIPIINSIEDIEQIDKFLRDNNMLILFKAHPVQPLDANIASKLTNFKVITNDDLKNADIQLYELLGKTDAMITDYSSVYYDYLLADKPIGLTVDDIDDYIANRGFVYEDPFEVLKGEKILNTADMISFLTNIRDEKDITAKERREVKDRIYPYEAGHSTEYIAEHIYSEIMKLL